MEIIALLGLKSPFSVYSLYTRRAFFVTYKNYFFFICRRIEEHTMRCAVTVGDCRPSDVVTKIRQIILRSDNPEAVHYMRGIAAIRQALNR